MRPHPAPHDETRGLWLGLLGVVIFAMTLYLLPPLAQ